MSPEECHAKAAQVRAMVDEQPDFAETAERIAREWERAAATLKSQGRRSLAYRASDPDLIPTPAVGLEGAHSQ